MCIRDSNKKGIKFKSLWRTLFVITIAVPQFVSLLLMNHMLQSNGAINILLSNITNSHVEIQWLNQDATLARWVVIIINCWVCLLYTSNVYKRQEYDKAVGI